MKKENWIFKEFKELFLMDSATEVAEHVVKKVIEPRVRDMIFEVITEASDRFIYGKDGRTKSASVTYSQNTGSTYKPPNTTSAAATSTSVPKLSEVSSHKFISRVDAETVFEKINEYGKRYGCVSVSNFCEFSKIKTGGNYMWNDYGWDAPEIEGARIKYVPGGYMIDLPPCHPLR